MKNNNYIDSQEYWDDYMEHQIEEDENEDDLWGDCDEDDDDYTNFDCTCGAWFISNITHKPVHVADCICGSSEPDF